MASDVDQQGGVVHRGALEFFEIEALGDAQGDPALAEYVLHGLAETKVDAEGERRQQLGQAEGLRSVVAH